MFINVTDSVEKHDILINLDKVNLIKKTFDSKNGVIVFDKENIVVTVETYEELISKIQPKNSNNLVVESIDAVEPKDLDQYPAYLPRLPTGLVDKRTTVYKEYVEKHKAHTL